MAVRSRARAAGSILAFALALACASDPPPPPPQLFNDRPREWLQMRGDGQHWEPYAVEEAADHYAEQIVVSRPPTEEEQLAAGPEDDTVYWDFRVERRVDLGEATVAATADSLHARLSADCAVVSWKKLYRTADDALYEWTHDGCGGSTSEHEIVRFLGGSLGVHRASLRARGRRIPPELRTDWIRILSEARLTGSPPAPSGH